MKYLWCSSDSKFKTVRHCKKSNEALIFETARAAYDTDLRSTLFPIFWASRKIGSSLKWAVERKSSISCHQSLNYNFAQSSFDVEDGKRVAQKCKGMIRKNDKTSLVRWSTARKGFYRSFLAVGRDFTTIRSMRNENDGSIINTEIFFSGERESFWYHIAYNSKLSDIKGNSFLRLHDEISNPFHKWQLYPFSVDAIRNFMSEVFFYRCEFSAAQKFARQNREGGRRQKFALNDIRSNYIRISFWILPNMARYQTLRSDPNSNPSPCLLSHFGT